MGSIKLLDKTRKIGRLLHNGESGRNVITDMCQILSDILESNALIIDSEGKVLGNHNRNDISIINEMLANKPGENIDESLNDRFLSVLSTNENVNLGTLGFEKIDVHKYQALISPIYTSGERLGTLFLYKSSSEYDIDDIILSEYVATVIGLELIRIINSELAEADRNRMIVKGAMDALSLSELEAIVRVFDELGDMEGLLVASRIADKSGITRSVIVNALRKIEGAGVIETRSSGMKGTYIKVNNKTIYDEIDRVRQEKQFLN